jgi:hypothetical protein
MQCIDCLFFIACDWGWGEQPSIPAVHCISDFPLVLHIDRRRLRRGFGRDIKALPTKTPEPGKSHPITGPAPFLLSRVCRSFPPVCLWPWELLIIYYHSVYSLQLLVWLIYFNIIHSQMNLWAAKFISQCSSQNHILRKMVRGKTPSEGMRMRSGTMISSIC